MTTDITIPHNGWLPRPHQLPLWKYLQGGGKRAMAIWHRRAGKDEIALHWAAVSAIQRPGNYWHALPEYAMARKAIWTSVNPHTGKRRIDEAFPPEMRESTNDHEMFIRFKGTGSTWQCIGSDQYNRTIGPSCVGLTMSEFAMCNPAAWGFYKPMLDENGGWAAFITTPRGRNHAYTMFNHAKHEPGWFAEKLAASDTGMLSQQQLDEVLREYTALYGLDHGTAMFRQELLCDFTASTLGSFYALEMAQVRDEERVAAFDAEPDAPMHWAWDIGVRDDTAAWAFQVLGAQVMVHDLITMSGVGVEHIRDELFEREKKHGWKHGIDYVPHDAKVKEWGSGRTRVETMQVLGLNPLLVPQASLLDGINAVRRMLPLCVFHDRTEDKGVSALELYRREWDDEAKTFRANAVHDWTSHPADAFRYLAQGYRPAPIVRAPDPIRRGWVIPPPQAPRRGGIRL